MNSLSWHSHGCGDEVCLVGQYGFVAGPAMMWADGPYNFWVYVDGQDSAIAREGHFATLDEAKEAAEKWYKQNKE